MPEARLAVNVYLTLKRAFGGVGPKGSGDEHGVAGRVGVISPYAQQIKVLREKFQASFVISFLSFLRSVCRHTWFVLLECLGIF